jgi:hypothetical protein
MEPIIDHIQITVKEMTTAILALVSRARWVQWAAGLSYLVMLMWYTIAFCGTLS